MASQVERYDRLMPVTERTPRNAPVLDLAGHLKGEHELVPLENARARVIIHVPHHTFTHVPQPVVQYYIFFSMVQGLVEDS